MTNEPPRDHASKGVTAVRASAIKALDVTAGAARDLARQTAKGIEANPVGILAGGIALGALAGAFIPRSVLEATLLRSVGKRLGDSARGALDAAKDSAASEFDMLGLTRDAARRQVGKLVGDVLKALAVAGTAGLAAAKAAPPNPEPTPAPKKIPSKKATASE